MVIAVFLFLLFIIFLVGLAMSKNGHMNETQARSWILSQPDLDDWETGLIDAALYGSTESAHRLAVLRAVRLGDDTHGEAVALAEWMQQVTE